MASADTRFLVLRDAKGWLFFLLTLLGPRLHNRELQTSAPRFVHLCDALGHLESEEAASSCLDDSLLIYFCSVHLHQHPGSGPAGVWVGKSHFTLKSHFTAPGLMSILHSTAAIWTSALYTKDSNFVLVQLAVFIVDSCFCALNEPVHCSIRTFSSLRARSGGTV